LTAARLLWNAVKNDPALLRSRVILKVLFKIAVVTLVPPQQAQALLTRAKGLANTTTLLGYLQLDVS
jgi:hypothetical protein